ncbi:hypothetical protein GQ85_08220 [Rhodococcus rhodochrous]|nr:hypothetical protein GQ85_08220 [Rhodococcus rhodochrous]
MTAVIAGVGESKVGRRLSMSVDELQVDAVLAALEDAGLDRTAIDAVYTDGAIAPGIVSAPRLMSLAGLAGVRETGYFSMAGAGVAYAVAHATRMIESGELSAALVYFGVDWGTQPEGPYGFHKQYPSKSEVELAAGFFGQPTYYAAMAQRYAAEFGYSPEEMSRALGVIAISTRGHAAGNPTAQISRTLDREIYAVGKTIASPLTINDCCVISDGAGAIIVADSALLAGGAAGKVRVAGWGHDEQPISDDDFFTQNPDYPFFPTATSASAEAFAMAGVGWDDIDVVLVYDCFTISVLLQLESSGFWKRGTGVRRLIEDGDLRSDAARRAIPLNTHGGLLSHAYLLGISHVIEATRQLRGNAGPSQVADARRAVVSMVPFRAHTTLILEVCDGV